MPIDSAEHGCASNSAVSFQRLRGRACLQAPPIKSGQAAPLGPCHSDAIQQVFKVLSQRGAGVRQDEGPAAGSGCLPREALG